ncbi:MAG: aminopeptidase N [Congregibacter sp.]
MRDAQPTTIFLKDYTPPPFTISEVTLHFELFDTHTLVHARLAVERAEGPDESQPLVLDGQELELVTIVLDGRNLEADEYTLSDDALTVHRIPDKAVLETTARILPQENTSLEGLYRSRGLFCTQCEAEGFRKISWYLDRPDVMATFRVTIDADKTQYPELLSNGNLESRCDLDDGRHRAVWHDPFPKPSYLFALVAGDLCRVEDQFRTRSGKSVDLVILVEEKDLDKCEHAMDSLKRSMRWDEERFGREYDLGVFHIVAVDDFNMGAMENKSLNIFNTSCVLASPDTTTDAGDQRIESIVGHEYFHNWSGNRVTCRDWFQLSLKEGFTVFRDAEFSADMGSRSLKRVEDVAVLRTLQFAEDGGPMSHPVRPDSFIEISNFYTLTVYEKGAEVVRMLHTLLGEDAFRRGSDLYFERHDGQAVTCDDFVQAMEDASGRDLSHFKRWYSQSGTPVVEVSDRWDENSRTYELTIKQHTPPTADQAEKQPLLIPFALGLLGEAGALRLSLEGEAPYVESADNTHRVLILEREEQTFRFTDLPERPVPSLLRDFSAPVRLIYPYTREQLTALISRDDDGFNRADAMQQLMVQVIEKRQQSNGDLPLDPSLVSAASAVLSEDSDRAIRAEMLSLPTESYLAELSSQRGGIDVEGIHDARAWLRKALANALRSDWERAYEEHRVTQSYAASGEQIGRRALANVALDYLIAGDDGDCELACEHYMQADNLTDRLAALRAVLREGSDDDGAQLLEDFYSRFAHESLALNHWFQVQAEVTRGDAIARVRSLMEHEAYDAGNPNKIRSLVGAFANGNPVSFHRGDGLGYRLLGEVVEDLNQRNPQIASRLLTPLTRWRRFPIGGEKMKAELERLAALPALSPDVYEVLNKSLA